MGTLLGGSHADAWPMVAAISERLWRTRFSSDPAVLGQTLHAEGHLLTIVGVVPETFTSPNLGWGARPDIWVPMASVETLFPSFRDARVFTERSIPSVLMIGRLAPGASLSRAQPEADVIAAALAEESPASAADVGLRLMDAGRAKFWPANRNTVLRSFAAFGVAALLLLGLTFSNLLTLLTQQALSRRSEVAVRLALGATRGTLVRQVAAEASALGLLTFLVSMVAAVGLQHLLTLSPNVLGIGLALDLRLDTQLVAVCVVLSFGLAWLGAMMSVLTLTRGHIARDMRTSQRTTTSSMSRARYALVGVQVTASAALFTTALMVAGSAMNAANVDLGFSTSPLLVVSLDTSSSQAELTDVRDSLSPALEALATLPGVTSVALSSRAPLDPVGAVANVGIPADGGAVVTIRRHQQVTARYFEALDIPLRQGRAFTPADDEHRLPVAVVSESLARRLWPDGRGVGERVFVQQGQSEPTVLEVVGIAADTRFGQIWEPDSATIYTTQWSPTALPHILVRAPGDVVATGVRLPGALRVLPAELSLAAVTTGEDRVASALAPFNAASRLFAALAVVAIVVAMIGLYATLAHLVEQRTREIALRLALGGGPMQVASSVVRAAVVIALGATLTGVWAAAAMAPLLASQTRDFAWDGWSVFVSGALGIAACCVIAAALPAVRATRVPPMLVLRDG